MCVAVPMRITEINKEKSKARAELGGNELEIDVRLVSAKEGDFALVHAGCALEIIKEDSAQEILALLNDLEEAAGGEN